MAESGEMADHFVLFTGTSLTSNPGHEPRNSKPLRIVHLYIIEVIRVVLLITCGK